MCYQLSRMGAKVILSARNEQKLEEVKNSLAHPEDARYIMSGSCPHWSAVVASNQHSTFLTSTNQDPPPTNQYFLKLYNVHYYMPPPYGKMAITQNFLSEPCIQRTLRLVFLAMSKFSVLGVKRIWRVLILAFFFKEHNDTLNVFVLVDTVEWVFI